MFTTTSKKSMHIQQCIRFLVVFAAGIFCQPVRIFWVIFGEIFVSWEGVIEEESYVATNFYECLYKSVTRLWYFVFVLQLWGHMKKQII